ncbi:ylmG homolog protein 1-1, chloroplastic-like isoform X1 [Musa acuminata AAA Group]|uniref:ylmG homolog protein 1-1, chloroplastic-like isoform X1 n=1 Tax=Musa acuminata AAA Group TaxID=214697 RepID=UPI0031E3BF8B
MALPSASITRFDLSGHQKVTGILRGSVSPLRFAVNLAKCRLRHFYFWSNDSQQVLIRSIRRGKVHHTISRSGSRCLLNVTVPCSIQSALMTASATPYDPSRCVQPSLPIIPQNLGAALSEYIQGLIIADIDPATVKLAISVTGPFLSAFGFLFILRIIMSWYPKLPVKKFPYIIAYVPTEPFLSITRKVIPPLAGVDVTPVVWFGLVSFLNEILVGPQGLLVLLSQQL